MDTQPYGQPHGYDEPVSRSGDSADSPGIEVPPAIGQDERRMHVRAYNFWAKLLAGRSFPSIEALDVSTLGDFSGHAVLLDFTGGIENPAIAYLGEAIALEGDLPDNVEYIADVPRRSLLSRLTDHYLQIIANRAPVGFEAEFVNAKGATILYRGVLLPFSSDDDTIDFIMGVINWKQAAEPALSDAIAEEMATVAAVSHPARPTMPVWGDGPTGGPVLAASLGGARLPALTADPDDTDAVANVVPMFAELPDRAVGDEIDPFVGSNGEPVELADWLASARTWAEAADDASLRGRQALYRAIGRARGFALAAEADPDGYAELLDEAAIKPSPRAPLTALSKLVFGSGYDKTRLAELTAVLAHANRIAIDPDALVARLEREAGGLKALVKEARAAARAEKGVAQWVDSLAAGRAIAESAPVLAEVEMPGFAAEHRFVALLARRDAMGRLSILGGVGEKDAATIRLLKAIGASAPK